MSLINQPEGKIFIMNNQNTELIQPLDRMAPQPLHAQFENIIRSRIDNEDWTVNSCIPSENELSRIYGISRVTVHTVLNRIVSDGLLYRVPGKGTFVATPKIEGAPLTHIGIQSQLEKMGYTTTTKVIELSRSLTNNRIIRQFNMVNPFEIYIIKRLRLLENIPFSYHVSYIPVKLFEGIEKEDFETRQLCDIIEKTFHTPIAHRTETLEVISATPELAELFAIKASSPLLLLENMAYNTENVPIEYSTVTFRGDRIKIKLQYDKASVALPNNESREPYDDPFN